MKRFFSVLLCAAVVSSVFAANKGALNGVFSVSATKKVHFSEGNLGYTANDYYNHNTVDGNTTGLFYFSNINRGSVNQYASLGRAWSTMYTIDLFNFGTSGYNGQLPSKYDAYCDGNFDGTNYDWGVYNSIQTSKGVSEVGAWRTLTRTEWEYLAEGRTNATALYGLATITVGSNSYTGLVLLPDNWTTAPAGTSFTAGHTNYDMNTYDATQWAAMEAAGAVFLPAVGFYNNAQDSYGTMGCYWTSSYKSDMYAYCFQFGTEIGLTTEVDGAGMRANRGCSVRLVEDVPVYSVVLTQPEHGTIEQVTAYDLQNVAEGTEVTLHAVPETGGMDEYVLDAWYVNGTKSDVTTPTLTLTINAATTVTCTFKVAHNYQIQVQEYYSEGTLVVTDAEDNPITDLSNVVEGTTLKIQANPYEGYYLYYFVVIDDYANALNYYTNPLLLNVDGNYSISAVFTTTPTSIDTVGTAADLQQAQKVVRGGQLLILRGGKTYNALGAEVK